MEAVIQNKINNVNLDDLINQNTQDMNGLVKNTDQTNPDDPDDSNSKQDNSTIKIKDPSIVEPIAENILYSKPIELGLIGQDNKICEYIETNDECQLIKDIIPVQNDNESECANNEFLIDGKCTHYLHEAVKCEQIKDKCIVNKTDLQNIKLEKKVICSEILDKDKCTNHSQCLFLDKCQSKCEGKDTDTCNNDEHKHCRLEQFDNKDKCISEECHLRTADICEIKDSDQYTDTDTCRIEHIDNEEKCIDFRKYADKLHVDNLQVGQKCNDKIVHISKNNLTENMIDESKSMHYKLGGAKETGILNEDSCKINIDCKNITNKEKCTDKINKCEFRNGKCQSTCSEISNIDNCKQTHNCEVNSDDQCQSKCKFINGEDNCIQNNKCDFSNNKCRSKCEFIRNVDNCINDARCTFSNKVCKPYRCNQMIDAVYGTLPNKTRDVLDKISTANKLKTKLQNTHLGITRTQDDPDVGIVKHLYISYAQINNGQVKIKSKILREHEDILDIPDLNDKCRIPLDTCSNVSNHSVTTCTYNKLCDWNSTTNKCILQCKYISDQANCTNDSRCQFSAGKCQSK